MYILNTTFKKNINWWFWKCKIYQTQDIDIIDITKFIALEFKYEYKKDYMIIPFWSWTADMRLSEQFMEWNWSKIYNVSI